MNHMPSSISPAENAVLSEIPARELRLELELTQHERAMDYWRNLACTHDQRVQHLMEEAERLRLQISRLRKERNNLQKKWTEASQEADTARDEVKTLRRVAQSIEAKADARAKSEAEAKAEAERLREDLHAANDRLARTTCQLDTKSAKAAAAQGAQEKERSRLSGLLSEARRQVRKDSQSLARERAARKLFQGRLTLAEALAAPPWSPRRRRLLQECRSAESWIRASALFDADWYRSTYPDLAEVASPLRHYILQGCYEGRDPSADFDTIGYCLDHPEALESGICPLLHHLERKSASKARD